MGTHDTPLGSNLSVSLELGEVLVRETRLTPEQLEQARLRQTENHERLSDVLIEEGFLNADEVLHALGHQQGLPVVSAIDPNEIDETLLARVPITFAKQHRILPLCWVSEGVLRVALADPLEVSPLDDLHLASPRRIRSPRRPKTISTRWRRNSPTNPRIFSIRPTTRRSSGWSTR